MQRLDPDIRRATPKDLPEIMSLVRELAIYERAEHKITSGLDVYRSSFEEGHFDALISALDDNIIGHPRYAKALFEAIKPLKIKWVGQASVSLLVKDNELMKLAAESGCKALFFGIESVSKEQLLKMRKAYNEIEHMEEAIKKIKKMGILIHASMVFGFDDDTKEIFNDTVKFLIKNKVSTVSFNILTPYPGTKTYNNLKEEGRLTTSDWHYYDHKTVVFKPKNKTPYELQAGKVGSRKKLYNISSVMKRFSGNMYSPLIYFATNYGHMKQVKVEARRMTELKSELFVD